ESLAAGGELERLECVERDRVVDRQRADPLPAQRAQVRAATQALADVGGQRADVGALAAANPDRRAPGGEGKRVDRVNRHAPRGALDRYAGTRVLVQRTAVALERRVHRWHLLDRADEGGRDGAKPRLVAIDLAVRERPTFGVAGVGGRAQ